MAKGKDGRKPKLELLRKITTKAIIGGVGAVRKCADSVDEGEVCPLFTAYGVASGLKPWSKDMGDGKVNSGDALLGTFEAVRASDGRVYRSAQIFLPEPIHGMLVAQLKGGAVSAKFACEVGVKAAPDAAVGYEYFATPLSDAADSDVMQEMRALAHDKAA